MSTSVLTHVPTEVRWLISLHSHLAEVSDPESLPVFGACPSSLCLWRHDFAFMGLLTTAVYTVVVKERGAF